MPEEEPTKCYLDTSLLMGWIKRVLAKGSKKAEYTEFFDFLKAHPELETHISAMTVCEIIEEIQTNYATKRLPIKEIESIIKDMMEGLGIKLITSYKTSEGMPNPGIITLNAKNLVDLTYKGGDVKDSIHVEIARINNLWLVHRDEDMGTMKDIWFYIKSYKKLMKQHSSDQSKSS